MHAFVGKNKKCQYGDLILVGFGFEWFGILELHCWERLIIQYIALILIWANKQWKFKICLLSQNEDNDLRNGTTCDEEKIKFILCHDS